MFDGIAERAGRALCLGTEMYMEGDRSLMIENCRRIEECTDVFMRLICGGLRIEVWGSGLRASEYSAHGLAVTGRIERIDFAERGRRDVERPDKG